MGLVKGEAFPGVGEVAGGHAGLGDGLFLPLDGVGEVTGLGAGGGKGIEGGGDFPRAEVAGDGGGVDGFLAVAEPGLRAGGKDPGEVVVGFAEGGIELDGAFAIGDGLVVGAELGVGEGAVGID